MSEPKYDLAIIGAGAAGLIAADFAVKLGARVALLKKNRIGGDCTWTGCVPSKSLIKVASVAQNVRTRPYDTTQAASSRMCRGFATISVPPLSTSTLLPCLKFSEAREWMSWWAR